MSTTKISFMALGKLRVASITESTIQNRLVLTLRKLRYPSSVEPAYNLNVSRITFEVMVSNVAILVKTVQ
jgi:hypothetical protein